jgi:hypothetical protein
VIPALVLVVILGLLAVFQLALIGGAPWGRLAWGGAETVLSPRRRVASAVSIVLYAAIAVVELDRAGVIDLLPDPVAVVGAWVIFGYFCLGIVMNLLSRSRLERLVMTPVVVVLAVLGLLIALG